MSLVVYVASLMLLISVNLSYGLSCFGVEPTLVVPNEQYPIQCNEEECWVDLTNIPADVVLLVKNSESPEGLFLYTVLTGTDNRMCVMKNGGNVTLVSVATGTQWIRTGNQDDVIDCQYGYCYLYLRGGNDYANCRSLVNCSIYGGIGDDFIVANSAYVRTTRGNDTVVIQHSDVIEEPSQVICGSDYDELFLGIGTSATYRRCEMVQVSN